MRTKIIISLVSLFALSYSLTSCLEGDPENTPPVAANAILQMTNNPNGANTVNSGLRYFGAQALTYPASHEADTATFAVTIQGVPSLGEDLNVTLSTPAEALDDYYATDSIVYEMMPDDLYDFIGPTSAVIPAGKSYVEFKVKFYPSKIDPTKNYMLPITATNDANHPMSSNYGFVYYHVIGNPIAGTYSQEWIRWNNSTGIGNPNFDLDLGDALFAPLSPTSITVDSGTGVTYILSFKQSGSGVLSNFKVELDAASVTAADITITAAPVVMLANPSTGQYEFKFSYDNSSQSPRVIIDKFSK